MNCFHHDSAASRGQTTFTHTFQTTSFNQFNTIVQCPGDDSPGNQFFVYARYGREIVQREDNITASILHVFGILKFHIIKAKGVFNTVVRNRADKLEYLGNGESENLLESSNYVENSKHSGPNSLFFIETLGPRCKVRDCVLVGNAFDAISWGQEENCFAFEKIMLDGNDFDSDVSMEIWEFGNETLRLRHMMYCNVMQISDVFSFGKRVKEKVFVVQVVVLSD